LADTVREFDAARPTGTGFLFDALSSNALLDAVRRAVAAFARPELWSALVKNAMTEDFSWDASAREYATLYKKILRPQAPRPSRRSR
jgi:starch synthase